LIQPVILALLSNGVLTLNIQEDLMMLVPLLINQKTFNTMKQWHITSPIAFKKGYVTVKC